MSCHCVRHYCFEFYLYFILYEKGLHFVHGFANSILRCSFLIMYVNVFLNYVQILLVIILFWRRVSALTGFWPFLLKSFQNNVAEIEVRVYHSSGRLVDSGFRNFSFTCGNNCYYFTLTLLLVSA
ncbi:hypothetical protein FOCC_FOCC015182 [Frankliniella occidentalis]|nr:hypothetical protein FOCC_FOCC015182 [Frankliniella occidentalis]